MVKHPKKDAFWIQYNLIMKTEKNNAAKCDFFFFVVVERFDLQAKCHLVSLFTKQATPVSWTVDLTPEPDEGK